MRSFRLTVAYDGGPFRGWAAQPGLRTVQAELEAALAIVLRRTVKLTVAGRTDAGVHALAQVASFHLVDEPDSGAGPEAGAGEPETGAALARRLRRSLNAITPPEIAVSDVAPAPEGFDARHDARSRSYCYRLYTGSPLSPFERGRALWWPYPLDRERLHECAALLVGCHNFTAFTPTQTEHVHFEREVFAAHWQEEPQSPLGIERIGDPSPELAFQVEADAFMRSMVRTLVGTMLQVGRGKRSVESFADLLAGAPRNKAGDTAPPHGLYLTSVRY